MEFFSTFIVILFCSSPFWLARSYRKLKKYNEKSQETKPKTPMYNPFKDFIL